MEIKKPAMAGTLESSDCMVTVEPGQGKVDLELSSVVIRQFGPQIRKVIFETLERLEVTDARVTARWTAPSRPVWSAPSSGAAA